MTGVFGTDFTDFVGLGCRLGGQAFLIVRCLGIEHQRNHHRDTEDTE